MTHIGAFASVLSIGYNEAIIRPQAASTPPLTCRCGFLILPNLRIEHSCEAMIVKFKTDLSMDYSMA